VFLSNGLLARQNILKKKMERKPQMENPQGPQLPLWMATFPEVHWPAGLSAASWSWLDSGL
jgi:hypothetical protein